jgi:IclR family mhp operon transcriptional activator
LVSTVACGIPSTGTIGDISGCAIGGPPDETAQRDLQRVPLCGTIPNMGRPLENRSLDRGLTILHSLSLRGASSLQDLHADTDLPKSTIRRILGTLVRRKIVRRSINDQLYRSNVSLPVQSNSRSAPAEGRLVDCAMPHMTELTREVGWACDLHIFERTRTRIVESTRPLSPYFQYDRRIDLAVPVFAAAAGLAVLATWTDRAVSALVDEIGDDPIWGLGRVGMTKRDLLKSMQLVRARGYATRASLFRGQIELSDRLHAIARPVFRGDAAIGGLAILWPKGFLSPEDFTATYLPRFTEVATAITADLGPEQ